MGFDVVAVNRQDELFLTNEDEVGTLKQYLDSDGELCDPDEGVVGIGLLPSGKWVTIPLGSFEDSWNH